jgi:hypothetical protein
MGAGESDEPLERAVRQMPYTILLALRDSHAILKIIDKETRARQTPQIAFPMRA